jgi:putative ABC transport system substrate-binding protein
MFNPDTSPVSAYMPSFETAARSLKVEPITKPVYSDIEIETAITALGREPGGGFVIPSGGLLFAHRVAIILAAARNNVRSVRFWHEAANDKPGKNHGGQTCVLAPNSRDYADSVVGIADA